MTLVKRTGTLEHRGNSDFFYNNFYYLLFKEMIDWHRHLIVLLLSNQEAISFKLTNHLI